MTLWLWRGARRGVVTTAYPRRLDQSASTLPTPPSFVSDLLDRALASRLVGVCPSSALVVVENELELSVGRCTACGRCLEVAGAAGRRSPDFEWASADRRRLFVRIPIGGGG